ncbi:MAG: ABC transporter ATP-binding protein [Elusimicrobiota bacterium]|jgi:ABC-2 type transport system ATP-binding protein|nr:ABC transporter ATP-binding protein [Elusimicrobiota bacterium]
MKNNLLSVRVKNAAKKMGKNQALDNVSLFFDESLVHGIIGPNGAGKTTLIRLMINLLKIDRGSVKYYSGGKELDFAFVKEQSAYFPQEQSLYSDLSCIEHLEFFARLYNISSADFMRRSRNLLELTGLLKFSDRKAGNLSGGMYKKLGLVCVLLNRPKILFLDEPTIGVDPLSRRELWDLVYGLSNETTVILSTSYMDEAVKCAKTHILNEGKSIASGNPQELLEQFKVKNFEDIFLKSIA